MELLEIADLLAALHHDGFNILYSNAAIHHHYDHVIQQVVYKIK